VKILKIWDSEYPWDVRAEKVMRSLTEAGHDVHLLARNRRHDPVREELPEATVHRLRPWAFLGRTLDAASQFPAFMNPRWGLHMTRWGRRTSAEAILVRDLPLAPTAVWAGRRLGIPVIMDMAENYPAMIKDVWLDGRQGRLDFLVRNPTFVARVERWSLDRLDHVIVVVEESGERLVQLGLPPERVSVVSNTPWPERIPPTTERARGHGESAAPLRMVYLGLLEKPRGLDAVLQGMRTLADKGVDLHLDIIGGGRDADGLKRETDRLKLDGAVTFHGVLPYEEALGIFGEVDIGLVPHLAVESWNTTIPNKLFDYMSHGLPVISSDARPAARVVREVGSGVVFRSDDADDFAAAVEKVTDPGVRAEMAGKGRTAVQERYNWEVEAERLLETLDTVVSRYRQGGAR
jgi:glycosyltransferase involved in cell wall biosynthesis